ncbi:MAG: hypothetical protein Q7U57_03535 [Methylovulum sp.]|nr:hypothetical protein [Methylovulum sp.]
MGINTHAVQRLYVAYLNPISHSLCLTPMPITGADNTTGLKE